MQNGNSPCSLGPDGDIEFYNVYFLALAGVLDDN